MACSSRVAGPTDRAAPIAVVENRPLKQLDWRHAMLRVLCGLSGTLVFSFASAQRSQ
jgi:hypothetical protein